MTSEETAAYVVNAHYSVIYNPLCTTVHVPGLSLTVAGTVTAST